MNPFSLRLDTDGRCTCRKFVGTSSLLIVTMVLTAINYGTIGETTVTLMMPGYQHLADRPLSDVYVNLISMQYGQILITLKRMPMLPLLFFFIFCEWIRGNPSFFSPPPALSICHAHASLLSLYLWRQQHGILMNPSAVGSQDTNTTQSNSHAPKLTTPAS